MRFYKTKLIIIKYKLSDPLIDHAFQKFPISQYINLTLNLEFIFSALFNETSLQYPELSTDINRLLPILLMYKHVSMPKHFDEISNRIMEMYFPSGKIESNSHLDTVKVLYNI